MNIYWLPGARRQRLIEPVLPGSGMGQNMQINSIHQKSP